MSDDCGHPTPDPARSPRSPTGRVPRWVTDEAARRPPQGAVLRRVYTVSTHLPAGTGSHHREKLWITLASVIGMVLLAFIVVPQDRPTGVAAPSPAHVSDASPENPMPSDR